MVMEWRHEQHPLAPGLKAKHLQDHGDGLDHKHAADNGQEKLLLATDRNHSQRTANGKRSGVPHEDSRWVTIEPKKSKPSSGQCRTHDGQLSALAVVRKIKIGSNGNIAHGIG